MRLLPTCFVLLSVAGITPQSVQQSATMKFMSGEGYGFQLEAPSKWTYIERKGVDSYVGAIATNENDTLYFNMGRFSPSLDHPLYKDRKDEDENEDKYKSKETWFNINGYHAKFASHWIRTRSDYGIYFDSLWTLDKSNDFQNKMKLTIYGYNLSEKTKRQLNAAVKTIKFFKP
jgi:hypothetical protein